MTEDFYDLLEIPSDASQDEIKDAYREQVRVYHPDLNDDDRAQAQFTAVKTAYDILGDPVERQAYDRLGHEAYVAKRTSGLPSPDVWKSDDGGDEQSDDTELRYSEAEAQSTSSATAGSATAGSATAGSETADSETAGSRTSDRSSTTASTDTGSTGGTASAGTASRSTSTTETGAGSGTTTAGGGDTGTAREADRAGETSTQTGSRTTTATGNPIVRWWRRQNFSLPLLWLSLLVYVAGLIQFAIANESPLGSLWVDVHTAAGSWSLLSESRHGLETPLDFVQRVEFVAPPLEPTLWHAALAGVVVFVLGALLVRRVLRRETTWGAVTIDETIIAALALGTTTVLVGGPLLAGAVLMPLLFGVIVRHTRRLPGWTPSYLYVVPVLAPAAGFVATAAGVASLPVDLAAFVLVPLLGGLALPVRATVLKHVDR